MDGGSGHQNAVGESAIGEPAGTGVGTETQRGRLVVDGSGVQEGGVAGKFSCRCCSSVDSCVLHPPVGPKHVLRYTGTDTSTWTFCLQEGKLQSRCKHGPDAGLALKTFRKRSFTSGFILLLSGAPIIRCSALLSLAALSNYEGGSGGYCFHEARGGLTYPRDDARRAEFRTKRQQNRERLNRPAVANEQQLHGARTQASTPTQVVQQHSSSRAGVLSRSCR